MSAASIGESARSLLATKGFLLTNTNTNTGTNRNTNTNSQTNIYTSDVSFRESARPLFANGGVWSAGTNTNKQKYKLQIQTCKMQMLATSKDGPGDKTRV